MIGLTPQQRQLLQFIKTYLAKNKGVGPSFDEMKDALGLKSKSGAHRLITALEERGLICRVHNRSRAIEIVERDPLADASLDRLISAIERRGFNVSVTPAVRAMAA